MYTYTHVRPHPHRFVCMSTSMHYPSWPVNGPIPRVPRRTTGEEVSLSQKPESVADAPPRGGARTTGMRGSVTSTTVWKGTSGTRGREEVRGATSSTSRIPVTKTPSSPGGRTRGGRR